jgi:photosynthetic reaction center cytochrome c subunit
MHTDAGRCHKSLGFASMVAIAVTLPAINMPSASAQAANAPPQTKTTEQAFKNIQVLKGLPADQLIPSMQFISASLGVECDYCHVQNAFDKDDKKPKPIARKMIQMMFAINKDNFEGHREVTCNSCHGGSPHPAGIPAIGGEEARLTQHDHAVRSSSEGTDSGKPESADPIVEKYLAAVGGSEALQKISSRVEKGSAIMGGHPLPIEIYAQAPDKRVSVTHLPDGDIITAYDGHTGWLGNPGRPPRPMGKSESEAARLDADMSLAAHIKAIFPELKVAPAEKVGDHELTVVRGLREGLPPVKLYFDPQSGLLVRMVRYNDSPLGLNPTQIDYADYRDAGGVKIPFRWIIARPSGSFTIQVEQAEQNVPIDPGKFAPPAPEKRSSP